MAALSGAGVSELQEGNVVVRCRCPSRLQPGLDLYDGAVIRLRSANRGLQGVEQRPRVLMSLVTTDPVYGQDRDVIVLVRPLDEKIGSGHRGRSNA